MSEKEEDHQIFPAPLDRQEDCDGYISSNCCGARIIFGDICTDCQEHCDCQCDDCDETDCLNRNSLN
jgi:hypothetical protein